MNRFACEECRVRKFRCSKARPSCTYCSKLGKPCVYAGKVVRSPLTREYVTSLEQRLQKLETAFSELLPDVDIEKVLSPESPVPGFSTWNVSKESEASVAKGTETLSPSSPEALPDISTGFEWAENQDPTTHILDGMAALSVNPRGAGYLGSSANVELLRSLHRNGWAMESSASNRIAASQIQKPSLHQAWTWNLLTQPANHRHLVNSLIDSYFYHFNTAYPIVHEATFRAQYNEVITKPDVEVWNMLFNVVIAIGGWCMDYDMTGVDELLHSNHQGLAQNMAIFSHGCLTLVQALLLMANYTQRQNNPNTGYCYLGVAMKMAISLGMHKELPDWEISPLDREMRRRVWLCLFAFESGSSMTYGRPILWPGVGTMDTKESLNVLDESLTPATTTPPEESKEATPYSSLIYQQRFHKLTNPMYSRRILSADIPTEELLSMDSRIAAWIKNVPQYLQLSESTSDEPEWLILARYRLIWRARAFQMLLLCPIVLQWATEKSSGTYRIESDTEVKKRCRRVCLEYSHKTIWTIEQYFSRQIFSPLADWYGLFWIFQASLIPIIAMVTEPDSSDASSWCTDIIAVKNILSSVKTHQKTALEFLDIVNRFFPSMDIADEIFEPMPDAADLLDQIYTQFTGTGDDSQLYWQT